MLEMGFSQFHGGSLKWSWKRLPHAEKLLEVIGGGKLSSPCWPCQKVNPILECTQVVDFIFKIMVTTCMKYLLISIFICFTILQVSLIVAKKTLFLYNLNDPENPIELAFQNRYGHIVAYKWWVLLRFCVLCRVEPSTDIYIDVSKTII